MATTLRGSVGLNGNNWYTDISTIQDMLNQIAVCYGGAARPFFTFGSYSQDLVDAIRNFQRVNSLYCDGRVDVNGASFKKMLTLLNKPIPADGRGTPPPIRWYRIRRRGLSLSWIMRSEDTVFPIGVSSLPQGLVGAFGRPA